MFKSLEFLGSSSTGNCALLRTAHAALLIDVGFSGREIRRRLVERGTSLSEIRAVFLTHEHSDHAQGIPGLASQEPLPFFANFATAEALSSRLKKMPQWCCFDTGEPLIFHDLQIKSFPVPHDAAAPVGYIFTEMGAKNTSTAPRQLAWLTDLGHVPAAVSVELRDADVIVLEANYDESLLELDRTRPDHIKQRIRSGQGHLSNRDALQFLRTLPRNRPRDIFLGHLSRNCNDVQLLQELLETFTWPDLRIHVIDPAAPEKTPVHLF